MLVFNGGLTIEQVEKLKNGYAIIYDKVPYKRAYATSKNTFEYVPKELYGAPMHIFRRYISEDCYSKQYIFLARYLSSTFEFCINREKKNYIMVCDIEEEIINKYIGVGKYRDYRIEYRLPRVYITPDKIKEFLYFEPYTESQMAEFRERYKEYYADGIEEEMYAKKLILERKLEFNSDRNFR